MTDERTFCRHGVQIDDFGDCHRCVIELQADLDDLEADPEFQQLRDNIPQGTMDEVIRRSRQPRVWCLFSTVPGHDIQWPTLLGVFATEEAARACIDARLLINARYGRYPDEYFEVNEYRVEDALAYNDRGHAVSGTEGVG